MLPKLLVLEAQFYLCTSKLGMSYAQRAGYAVGFHSSEARAAP